MSEIDGNYRFRNEGDLLVLQVCGSEMVQSGALSRESQEKWRDAKIEDLLNIKFNKHNTAHQEIESLAPYFSNTGGGPAHK